MPDPTAPLFVAYDRSIEASYWAQFAAAALAGHNAYGFYDHGNENSAANSTKGAVEIAAQQADMLLAAFRTRYHHQPEDVNGR
jgi:hypothetical protein